MSEVVHLSAVRNATKRWRALIKYRSLKPEGYFVELFFDEFAELGACIERGPNCTCIISMTVVPNGLLALSNLAVEESSTP